MTDVDASNTPGPSGPILKPETARKILTRGLLALLALGYLTSMGLAAEAAADLLDKTGTGTFLTGLTAAAVYLIACPAIGYGMYLALRAVPDSEGPAVTHKPGCTCTCPALTSMDVGVIIACGFALTLLMFTVLMPLVAATHPAGGHSDTYNVLMIAITATAGTLLATYPVHGLLRYRPKTPRK